MKKFFLAMALLVSMTMSAAQDAEVAGAIFGSSYDETINAVKGTFGEPSSKTSEKLVYLNKSFEGMRVDRVEFSFQDLNGVSKLNQARFYIVCPNKSAALAKMQLLAKKMQAKYSVSYDEEEGGVAFYKGGNSPLGIGNLFTIFVSPYQGKWTCQLRYGKFMFK